jgi:predicted thioesterase
MNIGDMVRVMGNTQVRIAPEVFWPECYGQVGVIVELLHAASTLPLANVMVLGNVDQFYLDELEIINESR